MRTITIPVKKSPENFVRNYLTHRIGSNLRLEIQKLTVMVLGQYL